MWTPFFINLLNLGQISKFKRGVTPRKKLNLLSGSEELYWQYKQDWRTDQKHYNLIMGYNNHDRLIKWDMSTKLYPKGKTRDEKCSSIHLINCTIKTINMNTKAEGPINGIHFKRDMHHITHLGNINFQLWIILHKMKIFKASTLVGKSCN